MDKEFNCIVYYYGNFLNPDKIMYISELGLHINLTKKNNKIILKNNKDEEIKNDSNIGSEKYNFNKIQIYMSTEFHLKITENKINQVLKDYNINFSFDNDNEKYFEIIRFYNSKNSSEDKIIKLKECNNKIFEFYIKYLLFRLSFKTNKEECILYAKESIELDKCNILNKSNYIDIFDLLKLDKELYKIFDFKIERHRNISYNNFIIENKTIYDINNLNIN